MENIHSPIMNALSNLCKLSFQKFLLGGWLCKESENLFELVPFKEDNVVFIFAILFLFDYLDTI